MLKLQYFGHLIRRTNSLEKTLMLGKTASKRRKGAKEDEMVESTDSMGMSLEQTLGDSEGQRSLACCNPRGHRVRRLRD